MSCYDGKAEPVSDMRDIKSSSRKEETKSQASNSLLDMLNDWAEHLNVSEKVLWAIGGLVLTAGAALLRFVSDTVQFGYIFCRYRNEGNRRNLLEGQPQVGECVVIS